MAIRHWPLVLQVTLAIRKELWAIRHELCPIRHELYVNTLRSLDACEHHQCDELYG